MPKEYSNNEQDETDVVSEALITASRQQSAEGYQRSESTESTGGFHEKVSKEIHKLSRPL